MKNRRIIFLAACMCSVVFLSGCSTDSLMDKMMGTETTVSSSASVDISKEDSDAVHVDANLEKPVFSVNPVESLQIPVGNTSGKLTCEAGITGEGTVTYQWYKNNVNSNGGGTPIEGATGRYFGGGQRLLLRCGNKHGWKYRFHGDEYSNRSYGNSGREMGSE